MGTVNSKGTEEELAARKQEEEDALEKKKRLGLRGLDVSDLEGMLATLKREKAEDLGKATTPFQSIKWGVGLTLLVCAVVVLTGGVIIPYIITGAVLTGVSAAAAKIERMGIEAEANREINEVKAELKLARRDVTRRAPAQAAAPAATVKGQSQNQENNFQDQNRKGTGIQANSTLVNGNNNDTGYSKTTGTQNNTTNTKFPAPIATGSKTSKYADLSINQRDVVDNLMAGFNGKPAFNGKDGYKNASGDGAKFMGFLRDAINAESDVKDKIGHAAGQNAGVLNNLIFGTTKEVGGGRRIREEGSDRPLNIKAMTPEERKVLMQDALSAVVAINRDEDGAFRKNGNGTLARRFDIKNPGHAESLNSAILNSEIIIKDEYKDNPKYQQRYTETNSEERNAAAALAAKGAKKAPNKNVVTPEEKGGNTSDSSENNVSKRESSLINSADSSNGSKDSSTKAAFNNLSAAAQKNVRDAGKTFINLFRNAAGQGNPEDNTDVNVAEPESEARALADKLQNLFNQKVNKEEVSFKTANLKKKTIDLHYEFAGTVVEVLRDAEVMGKANKRVVAKFIKTVFPHKKFEIPSQNGEVAEAAFERIANVAAAFFVAQEKDTEGKRSPLKYKDKNFQRALEAAVLKTPNLKFKKPGKAPSIISVAISEVNASEVGKPNNLTHKLLKKLDENFFEGHANTSAVNRSLRVQNDGNVRKSQVDVESRENSSRESSLLVPIGVNPVHAIEEAKKHTADTNRNTDNNTVYRSDFFSQTPLRDKMAKAKAQAQAQALANATNQAVNEVTSENKTALTPPPPVVIDGSENVVEKTWSLSKDGGTSSKDLLRERANQQNNEGFRLTPVGQAVTAIEELYGLRKYKETTEYGTINLYENGNEMRSKVASCNDLKALFGKLEAKQNGGDLIKLVFESANIIKLDTGQTLLDHVMGKIDDFSKEVRAAAENRVEVIRRETETAKRKKEETEQRKAKKSLTNENDIANAVIILRNSLAEESERKGAQDKIAGASFGVVVNALNKHMDFDKSKNQNRLTLFENVGVDYLKKMINKEPADNEIHNSFAKLFNGESKSIDVIISAKDARREQTIAEKNKGEKILPKIGSLVLLSEGSEVTTGVKEAGKESASREGKKVTFENNTNVPPKPPVKTPVVAAIEEFKKKHENTPQLGIAADELLKIEKAQSEFEAYRQAKPKEEARDESNNTNVIAPPPGLTEAKNAAPPPGLGGSVVNNGVGNPPPVPPRNVNSNVVVAGENKGGENPAVGSRQEELVGVLKERTGRVAETVLPRLERGSLPIDGPKRPVVLDLPPVKLNETGYKEKLLNAPTGKIQEILKLAKVNQQSLESNSVVKAVLGGAPEEKKLKATAIEKTKQEEVNDENKSPNPSALLRRNSDATKKKDNGITHG